jgi:glycosyltransferase involved in cell wall biosynthesis
MKPMLTIVIPCYNEQENIPVVIPEVQAFCRENNYRCIIVNDGSSDNSLKELEKFKGDVISVYSHSRNRGYGAAIKTGIRKANSNYIVTIDADGQHTLADIHTMLKRMVDENADICVGNRNKQGSTRIRNVAKSLIISFSKMFLKIKVDDLNSGMKMYRGSVVKYLVKWAPNGMPFSDVIALLFHQFRYKMIEEPITIKPRALGKSTINYKTAIETISEILYLIIHFMPFRFFGFIGLSFFAFGVIWGLPFVLNNLGITAGTALCILTGLIFMGFGILLDIMVRFRFENFTPEIPDDSEEA